MVRWRMGGIAALCAAGMLVGAAGAQARASSNLMLGAQANAGARIGFGWTARGVPRGGYTLLQRQMGFGNVWRTVRSLHAGTGMATIPGLALGRYKLRVAITDRRGHVLSVSARSVAVFGTVSLAGAFGSSGGAYDYGSGVFPYQFSDYGPMSDPALSVPSNPCRFVHFDFVAGDNDGSFGATGQTATATIVQQAADPVSTAATAYVPTSIQASLTAGQPWALNLDQPDGGRLLTWYLSGWGSCDSKSITMDFPAF